jgi:hypothetical protein
MPTDLLLVAAGAGVVALVAALILLAIRALAGPPL